MSADDSYAIREAQVGEQTEIASFLQKYYFSREVVTKMYLDKMKHRINETEKKIIEDDMKNMYAMIVANVPCLVVIHKESNKIVGSTVLIAEKNKKLANVKSSNKNFTTNIDLLREMSLNFQSELLNQSGKYVFTPWINDYDLFAQFPSLHAALKITFLSVHPEHCRRNLGTRLVQESVKYAKSKGIEFVYACCKTPFSYRTTEKNGFEKFADSDVTTYVDGDGKLVFEGEEPYIVPWMAKRIQMID